MKQKNWAIIGLLVVGWVIVLGQPLAITVRLRGLLARLATPFVRLGDYLPMVHSRRLLQAENQRLQADNELLRQQVRALQTTAQENVELRRLLEFRQHASYRVLGARVIGRDAGNWWQSIQLDRGARDGLRDNLPVVNADGLVGKTVAVSAGESRVLLLVDPGCQISALLQTSRWPGVVAGREGRPTLAPRCRMRFVDRRAKVQPGEAVISSGLGGVFPKGLLVGRVAEAEVNEQSGLYQDVVIEPAVDFHRLENVLVIVGTE